MSRRSRQSVAAAAAVLVLLAPTAALAETPPAWSVYVEQVPTAKGPKPTHGAGQSGQNGQTGQYVPLAPSAAAALQRKGGKDRNLLERVATSPELGAQTPLRSAAGPSSEQSPSAISAAFGIGSGPATLFVVLIAGAVLGFAAGRLRGRRG